MVYAMLIVFFILFYIQTITTAVNLVYNCSFLNNTYSTNAAVSNQFTFINQTSIVLIAEYAFVSAPLSVSTYDLGLIYPFSSTNYFVPFPILLNCASIVSSCQLKIMAGSTVTSRDAEPINVALTQFNYTSTSIQSNQRGLYLIQGQYQLSNCLLNDGQDVTDNQTIFNIQILYEKSVGTSCIPSVDTCGSSLLTNCSSSSLTCTCLSSNSFVSYSNSIYCADTLNTSNCTIFPQRCISYCNSTTSDICICPSDTLKIQRNNLYVCELPVDASNCSSNDLIRRCSYGQTCVNGQCVDENLTTIITTTNPPNSSTDRSLRIALGVIAGLLGTSVFVILGVFCWLRQRQKRRRRKAEKSLSPASSSSATSSIYISPIQQPPPIKRKPPPVNRVYQLPTENFHQNFSSFYRTDSFRQAVLSGRPQQTEYVSTRHDSLSYPPNDDYFDSRPYGTIEFTIPSQTQNNQNIYQTINPPPLPSILSHVV